VFASRSPQVARRASFVAAGVYFAVGLIPVVLGLAATHVLPGLGEPEHALPALARHYLPGAVYAVFAGAIVAAILSTVDSTLLVASSLTSHNLVARLRPTMTDAQRVRTARIGVAVFGVTAYVLALHADGVYSLTEEASAFGSSGVFVMLVLGLFTRFGQAPAALASVAAGVLAWIGGAYVFEARWPYLISLAASLAGYLLVATWCTARRRAAAATSRAV
jgi:Na+/proline symporter